MHCTSGFVPLRPKKPAATGRPTYHPPTDERDGRDAMKTMKEVVPAPDFEPPDHRDTPTRPGEL